MRSFKTTSLEKAFIFGGLLGVVLAIQDGLYYGWFEASMFAALPAGLAGAGLISAIKRNLSKKFREERRNV